MPLLLQVTVQGGTIEGNVGGVWVWDSARAMLQGVTVAGGPSHAILADGQAGLDVKVRPAVRNLIDASRRLWVRVLSQSKVQCCERLPNFTFTA